MHHDLTVALCTMIYPAGVARTPGTITAKIHCFLSLSNVFLMVHIICRLHRINMIVFCNLLLLYFMELETGMIQ